MTDKNSNDPFHNVALEMILNRPVEYYGWEAMGGMIHIRCFNNDPGIRSSLQFLRRTPRARSKVEAAYLRYMRETSGLTRYDKKLQTLLLFQQPSVLLSDFLPFLLIH